MLEAPGFPCPQCGFRVTATVQMLLGSEPLCCGQCGLKLTPVPESSASALEALRQNRETLERVLAPATPK